MKRILFIGDSITDAGRNYDKDSDAGRGYVQFIKAHLGLENPQEYEILNRGINCDRVVDLYGRIKKDIINLKPDIVSILIGVNDAGHNMWPMPNGLDEDKYYIVYDMLISDIKEALPDVKIIILEPFILNGDSIEQFWPVIGEEVEKRAAMAQKISEKHGLTFVPLQAGIDELCKKAPNSWWLGDGIHPTAMGHEFIKWEWLKAFNTL